MRLDDHPMRISHVIRGDEHLSNTPAQTRLYEALGWKPPQFAHLSMILGPDGTKLSKRHGATSVLEYRDQGFLPEALRNYLALLGWSTSDSKQLFTPEELVAAFDLPGCQKNPATFDPVKLSWMNGEYMRALAPADIVGRAEPFLKAGPAPRALRPVPGEASWPWSARNSSSCRMSRAASTSSIGRPRSRTKPARSSPRPRPRPS